jgi:hypothetical protein
MPQLSVPPFTEYLHKADRVAESTRRVAFDIWLWPDAAYQTTDGRGFFFELEELTGGTGDPQ